MNPASRFWRKSSFPFLAAIVLCCPAWAGENLITNPDMSLDDGVAQPAGWGTRVFPIEIGGGIAATPLGDGVFSLKVKGKTSTYWWEQSGLTLVPGTRYRFSFEVRTHGLDGGSSNFYVRNLEWEEQSPSLTAPSDTKGEWVARSCTFDAPATKKPGDYWVALSMRPGKSGSAEVEVRGLRLESMDPAAAKASRPMPETALIKLPSRIVPVDPLLARVDSTTGKIRFYWARAVRNAGCRLTCSLDAPGARPVSAPFGADAYATVALGRIKDGAHRISVTALGGDGSVLASNAYRIVAGRWKDPSKTGRRLNNFVTELVNCSLKDGEVAFERAEDGWTWISFDGDVGDAKGYLDGCPEAVLFRRDGEDVIEAQRYLKAGVHKLRVRGAKGGGLRIHAVRIVSGGERRGFDRSSCQFNEIGAYVFGLPFMRKYGFLTTFNTISSEGFAKSLSDPYSMVAAYFLSRGMKFSRETYFWPHETKDRDTFEGTYNRIKKDLWPGFPGGISVDENNLKASSLHSVNFSEAVWRIADEDPKNQVNVYYADTSMGVYYENPQQNVSEISSVVNSGGGQGLLVPELYMPVTPTREGFRMFIDANANLVASSIAMVPASRSHMVLYSSSFIMLGEWCNYYAPEADIKAQTCELFRSYAVDPRFSECAGIGFGGIGRGNEEYMRWAMRLLRYYFLEGGTGDLAKDYGFNWNPGFVKDPDFAKGFEHWKATAAGSGTLEPGRIHSFGNRYQRRMGGPGGCGDAFARFVVSKDAPNILSQRLTGLKPGAFYSLQFMVMDTIPSQSEIGFEKHASLAFPMTATVEGAKEVKALRISHPIRLASYIPEEKRRNGMWHMERYVFYATAPQATLVFRDRPDGATDDEGRTYLLNYVIFAPYFCEGKDDVRRIISTIRGEDK